MIRLLSSEMLRFRSRRMVKVLTLLAIIGIVLGAGLATLASKQPSDEQLAAAQQQRDRQVVRCVAKDGFDDRYGPRPADQSTQAYCEEHVREAFVFTDQLRVSELAHYVEAAGLIVIVIGLVIGASMVGASWQTGTITTILTWEPRRIRWLASRLIATAVGVFVVTLFLVALLAALLALGASIRGSTATDPDGPATCSRRCCGSPRWSPRSRSSVRRWRRSVGTPRRRWVRCSSIWRCSRAWCGGSARC